MIPQLVNPTDLLGRVRQLIAAFNQLTARVDEYMSSPSSGSGDVVGPASSVDNRIATFDGVTGKLIQDSGTAISDLAAAVHTHDDRYYTESEVDTALAGKAATSHTHAQADITNLVTDLAGKAASVHTHTASAITDFAEALDDRVAALLVAGANITLTYDDGAGTLTVAASSGSGLTHPQVMARTFFGF